MLDIKNMLEECDDISEVADLVNEERGIDGSAEMIAAMYAISQAEKAGEGIEELYIEHHLYELADHGGDFNHASALDLAITESEL